MFNLRSFLPLNFTLLIFTFVYCLLSKDASASSSFTSWNPALANGPCRAPPPQCPAEDEVCEKDQQAFLALRQVYSHLDDNQDGKVDTAESQEFVRDELKHDEDGDWRERQSNLHGADNVMTVEELWCNWVDGEAHNWTQVELVEWLVDSVELPQYREAFMRAELDGRMLPLLGAAAGGTGARFLTDILGVRIALHRRKLALKAIDVVLFGTPKRFSHVLKDFALLVAIGIVLLCTGLVLHQRNYAKQREAAMQRELEGLQRAEDTLANLRVQLSESEQFKQTVLQEKNMLELKLKLRDRATKEQENRERARRSSIELYGANSRDVISHLQEEVAQLTNSLRQTEMQLDTIQITSGDLQFWLQLTYEFELEHFNAKKRMAESQFQLVKESCEKIRKRRNALFGSMRMAHGEILTAVDERIVEARKTLEEVIADASERTVRWSQIQRACGFDVVSNPGLQTLLAQERSRLTTSNSNSHVPVSPNTFPSTSSISTASSDTSSVHAMRAQPVTTGNRFGSNSNLSTSSASTGFPRRLPNANATPADDNGLWLSIGPLNNAGGGVATNRIMGSRLDEEETSGLRSRATDSTMISTDSVANAKAPDSNGDAPATLSICGLPQLAEHDIATDHAHAAALPRYSVAATQQSAVWTQSSANSRLTDAATTHATSYPYASAHAFSDGFSSHAHSCSVSLHHNNGQHAKHGAYHALYSNQHHATSSVLLRLAADRDNTGRQLKPLDRTLSSGSAAPSGQFLGVRSAGRFPRTGSHDSMHSLGINHSHHTVFRKDTSVAAEAAEMKKELESLMLDAACAFANSANNNNKKKLERNRWQQITSARIAASDKYDAHLANFFPSTLATANPDDSICESSTDIAKAACTRTPKRDDLVSDLDVKSFLFRWRTKTRLAQLRRRSIDKSADANDATSTSTSTDSS